MSFKRIKQILVESIIRPLFSIVHFDRCSAATLFWHTIILRVMFGGLLLQTFCLWHIRNPRIGVERRGGGGGVRKKILFDIIRISFLILELFFSMAYITLTYTFSFLIWHFRHFCRISWTKQPSNHCYRTNEEEFVFL
jgi:hypothetical protein